MRWISLFLLFIGIVSNVNSQWIPQYSPVSEDLKAVQFIDENRG